jgi:DNA-damage-inducible protein J
MPKVKAAEVKTAKAKASSTPKSQRKVLSGMIRARIEPGLKSDAESVLEKLGLTPSEAIRLLYKQITLAGGLPFEVKIPSASTRKAMRDVLDDKVHSYESVDAMFQKLGF